MQKFRLAIFTGVALFLADSASAQEVHGVIAYGSEAGQENSIAYGFAWNFPAKDAALAEAMNACISSGGTNCIEVAWFANGCGALAIDQHGNAQGKPGMTQEQAEERALRSCEAVGGLGCNIVGSLCASPNGEPGTYSGSESVLPMEGAQAAVTTEAEDETLTREERVLVQQSLTALGFDTGPADGVFGQRTRSAIRDWQGASGYNATGEVTRDQFAALTTAEASADQEQGSEPRQEAADNQSDKVLVFGPDTGLKCSRENIREEDCWIEITNKKGCYWLHRAGHHYQSVGTRWSGSCLDNTAHGKGTLYGDYSSGRSKGVSEHTGEMVLGYMQGRWVLEHTGLLEGSSIESQYLDGRRVGRAIQREREHDGSMVVLEIPVYDDGSGMLDYSKMLQR